MAVTLLALALTAPEAASARRASSADRFEVTGCQLALVELLDDPAHGERLLPEGAPFTIAEFYGPGSVALSLWSFACERVDGAGERVRSVQLSLLSVQVEPPNGAQWPAYAVDPGHEHGNAVYYLQRFDFWLYAAFTDHAPLAEALRAAGLPVTHTPRLRFERSDRLADLVPPREDPITLPSTRVTVAAPGAGAQAHVQPTKQHPPHDHDNSWWHWTPGGGVTRMRLQLFDAIDKWCAPHTPGCATLDADGDLAAFFGGAGELPRTDGLGIDHDRIPGGVIELSRNQDAT
jgi:hypothetical protein